MVVYPRLPENLQEEWDELEQDKQDGYVTEKVNDFFFFSPASCFPIVQQIIYPVQDWGNMHLMNHPEREATSSKHALCCRIYCYLFYD